MTGIAIALSFIALFWIAYTNFGENEGAADGAQVRLRDLLQIL